MIKIVKSFLVLSLITSSVYAASGIESNRQSLIEHYDFTKRQMAKFPNLNFERDLRKLGLQALMFESDKKTYVDDIPTEASLRRNAELLIESNNDECKRDASSQHCLYLQQRLTEYKRTYQTDYVIQGIQYPTIDLTNYTYTLPDGTQFDLKKNAVTRVTPLTAPTSATETIADIPPTSGTETIIDNTALPGVSCEWMPGTSRRILTGDGCQSKICSAMVICTKNGKKIKRLATCSSDLCTENNATACHQQLGYGSTRAVFKQTTPTPQQNQNRQNISR